MADSSPGPQQQGAGQHSFLHRLIDLFFGTDDDERIKKRQLKRIGAELSKQKQKFYKPRTGQALGPLGRFFFEVYKVVGPAQSLLQGSENSKALKTLLIESFHNDAQEEARTRFTEEAIREAAKSKAPEHVGAEIREAMRIYLSGFDAATVAEINDTYTLIQQLIEFVRFDYYFTLRKFDSAFVEGSYGKPPKNDPINAEYISDDLKDFLEILLPLPFDADWDRALEVLKMHRNVDVVDPGAWKKLLPRLASVAGSNVLTQMIRHIDKDPLYKPLSNTERHHIVENHISILKTQVEANVQKLMRELRVQKIEQMAAKVFGTGSVQRLKNYSEKKNAEFTRRMIAGYSHVQALNYLARFLFDYYNLDVRLLISELFIVRAKWSDNSVSGQLSGAYSEVLTVSEALEEFDIALGDEGELGERLKRASAPVKDKEASSARKLRQIVHDIDERAMNFIRDAATNLITIARIVKNLIEDYDRKKPEYIMNWRELDSFTHDPLRAQLVAVYKKVYSFIQLMQVFVKK